MKFEYDYKKSLSNKLKHRIDFEEAQAIFEDPSRLELPAKSIDELRFLIIGNTAGKLWSMFITYRNSNIRIISVRRSSKKEIKLYEEENYSKGA